MTTQSFAEILEASTQRCRVMDAPLAQRLQAFADDVRLLDAAFADIVDRMVSRLKTSGAGETAPAPGERMHPFLLPDQDGHLVSLDQLLSRGPAVISFHRGHWCPYCRLNADALAKMEPEVTAAGGQVVAITPELQQFTSELKSDSKIPFPILTDLDNGYALALNLLIWVDDEKRRAMTAAGWDISAYQGNDTWTLPIPATFVVATDGVVKARFADPDYRKRMAIEDILTAVRQIAS
jgi:peroxiredoxin